VGRHLLELDITRVIVHPLQAARYAGDSVAHASGNSGGNNFGAIANEASLVVRRTTFTGTVGSDFALVRLPMEDSRGRPARASSACRPEARRAARP
jgi:hypothetical protein